MKNKIGIILSHFAVQEGSSLKSEQQNKEELFGEIVLFEWFFFMELFIG